MHGILNTFFFLFVQVVYLYLLVTSSLICSQVHKYSDTYYFIYYSSCLAAYIEVEIK